MTETHELICTGWDGASPLHALAAFGLLSLADRMQPGARLGWRRSASAWRPVVSPIADRDSWIAAAAGWLQHLGQVGSPDPGLNRKVREVGAELKKAKEQVKETTKAARNAAKAGKLDKEAAKQALAEALAAPSNEVERLERESAKANAALANANGAGIAHLGDIIGVSPGIFRDMALATLDQLHDPAVAAKEPATNDPVLVVRQLTALACDQRVDGGRLMPTPLSFSNGSSGQCLLKDARSCLVAANPAVLRASLTGSDEARVAGQTGLNWDPADQRSYALAWDDPATAGKSADAAANAFAFLGLGLLPCMPSQRDLTACGWATDKSFTWPIWESPLSLSVVMGLLASPLPYDWAAQHARGLSEVRCSQVINPTGKRNFFAPSIPVV